MSRERRATLSFLCKSSKKQSFCAAATWMMCAVTTAGSTQRSANQNTREGERRAIAHSAGEGDGESRRDPWHGADLDPGHLYVTRPQKKTAIASKDLGISSLPLFNLRIPCSSPSSLYYHKMSAITGDALAPRVCDHHRRVDRPHSVQSMRAELWRINIREQSTR